MKKLPILLSTLALTTGGVGALTSYALDVEQKTESVGGVEIPQLNSSGGVMINVVAGEYQDVILQENDYDKRVYISSVNPDKGEVAFEVAPPVGWKAQRVVLAQYNFKEGVTESEADLRYNTLGVDDTSDWAVILSDYSKTIGAIHKANSDVLKEANPNIVYYAVRFDRQAVVEGERSEFWVRGKINYRKCQKSSAFVENNMTCAINKNNLQAVDTYRLQTLSPIQNVDFPENETTQTWDDEWLKIQNKQWAAAQTKYSTLNTNVRKVVEYLGELDDELAKLSKTAPKTLGGDMLVTKTNNLIASVKNLRDYYNSLLGSGTEVTLWKEKVAALEVDKSKLQTEKLEIEAENTRLSEDNQTLTQEKQDLAVKAQTLTQDNEQLTTENQALEEKIRQLEQQLAGQGDKTSDNGVSNGSNVGSDEFAQDNEQKVATIENNSKTTEVIVRTVTVEAKGDDENAKTETLEHDVMAEETRVVSTETPEVPALGQDEGKFNWWWLLIPVVMLVGGLGLLWQRCFSGRRK